MSLISVLTLDKSNISLAVSLFPHAGGKYTGLHVKLFFEKPKLQRLNLHNAFA